MARHKEPLDRGLVTIRDPGLLKEGELSFVRNAIYLPGSNALQRARGRAAFGTATASAVDVAGLRDLKFDNGDHYLLAHASSSYLTAAVGDTGIFGSLVSGVGVGTQLEVVQFRNRYFLFNGVAATASGDASNRVVYLSATAAATTPSVRTHGLLPVAAAPQVTTAAGTFSQTVTGYYEYWTTEIAKLTQDGAGTDLESAFSGNPTTVFISAVGQVPNVARPSVVNTALTTHWRIYRSPKKDKESDRKFPTGFMISEMGTASAQAADSFTTSNTGFIFPPTVNTGASAFSDFLNASATLTGVADDASYASATGGVVAIKSQGVYGFNFGGFGGNVRGIEVVLEAYGSVSPIPITVTIGRGRNATTGAFLPDLSNLPPGARQIMGQAIMERNTASKGALITATAAPGNTLTLGGATDRWLAANAPPFTNTDFSGNFMVVVSFHHATATVNIDYVKVKVYYAAAVDSTIPFPTVVYTFGDITAQVAKNHPPPSASTGVMFQDSLVVNDVSNPGLIRWSYPGDPEAFPPTYFLDFETRENDQVRFIGVVNNRLIVGLDSSLWRVNYLPSERDATFDRGNAVEAITRNYGIVNPMCACTFSTDGAQERLAFVSNQGVHATDGYTLETYTGGLDWRGDRDGLGIAPGAAASNYVPQALINDRERQELLFYFRNDAIPAPGTGGRYFCLHFQYNELIDGKPRVSGMVSIENAIGVGKAAPKSFWALPRNNGTTEVFIGYGTAVSATASAAGAGQVYRETGTTIPAFEARVRYRTRRMFLGGIGNEWKLNELYGYCGLVTWASTPGTITYQTGNRKTNSVSEALSSKDYTFTTAVASELVHKVIFNQMCEGLAVSATVSGEGTYAQEFLVLDGEDFGVEDSGR